MQNSIDYAIVLFLFCQYEEAGNILHDLNKKFAKNQDILYWQGLTAYQRFRKLGEKENIRKNMAIEAENSLLRIINIPLISKIELLSLRENELNKTSLDIMSLWILLVLTLELKNDYPHFKIKTKNLPEIYSSQIMKIDGYLGYIAWTENTIHTKGNNNEDAKDFLNELIAKEPNRPEAYCKLWTIYWKEKNLEKCIEISEKLFLEGSEFDENEYT